MFHKELYLAVMTKQPEGLINKGYSFLNNLVLRSIKNAKASISCQTTSRIE